MSRSKREFHFSRALLVPEACMCISSQNGALRVPDSVPIPATFGSQRIDPRVNLRGARTRIRDVAFEQKSVDWADREVGTIEQPDHNSLFIDSEEVVYVFSLTLSNANPIFARASKGLCGDSSRLTWKRTCFLPPSALPHLPRACPEGVEMCWHHKRAGEPFLWTLYQS